MDTWERLDRFLAIGSEDGAHRAGTIALTPGSARAVDEAVRADGERVVRRLAACGHGRAPVIFALAAAAKTGDLPTRRAAFAALPEVCATGAQLLAFAELVQAF